jgi:hypothetical protein
MIAKINLLLNKFKIIKCFKRMTKEQATNLLNIGKYQYKKTNSSILAVTFYSFFQ